MPKRYFTAIGDKKRLGQDWPLAFCSGNSISDFKDWSIETVCLKADEIPDLCNDAKTFSQLVAGLLNAYYSGIDATKLNEEQLLRSGTDLVELGIPHPLNPELPF